MVSAVLGLALAATPLLDTNAATAPASADETAFRDLYKQLVEINTTLSVGNCTEAAEAMRARLIAAGIPQADAQVLTPPNRPKDGDLLAVLHGSDAKAKPMLLLAHIDVVEARRADWARDPSQAGRGERLVLRAAALDDEGHGLGKSSPTA